MNDLNAPSLLHSKHHIQLLSHGVRGGAYGRFQLHLPRPRQGIPKACPTDATWLQWSVLHSISRVAGMGVGWGSGLWREDTHGFPNTERWRK